MTQLALTLPVRELSLDTRNDSYHALTTKETESQRMIEVYTEHGNMCDRKMSMLTGLPMGTISARRAELMKQGKVMLIRDEDGSKRKVTYTVNGEKRTAQVWGLA